MTRSPIALRRGRAVLPGAPAVIIGFLLWGPAARAQTPAPDPVRAKLDSILKDQAAKLVRVVGPETAVFDPQKKTVTVRLFNPAADTARVSLSLRFAPVRSQKLPLTDVLLQADSVTADSLRRDSLATDSAGRTWSLESWVREPLPMEIWLAPHQTVALTLHVDVPAGLKPGEYSAHLLVRTIDVEEQVELEKVFAQYAGLHGRIFSVFTMPDYIRPPAVVKLLYRTGSVGE